MSIIDEVRAEVMAHSRSRCSVCEFIDIQPEEERVQWTTVMADKTAPHAAIFRAMKKHGWSIGDGPIETHRKRGHS